MPGHTITHPLLSQPVVELALKIPAYQSFKDGFDRIFFRNAVSKIKKPRALWRTIKGNTTGTVSKKFKEQASFIHDFLSDGQLLKMGIIDQAWFKEQMIGLHHGKIDHLWPVINLIHAQRWLNQWKI